MCVFTFTVCAEAYNPDEEEDDAESRVCNLLVNGISDSHVLCKENNNKQRC